MVVQLYFFISIALPAQGHWTVASPPYRSSYIGYPCTVLQLRASDGTTADVMVFRNAAPPSDDNGPRWRAIEGLKEGDGRWCWCGWGIRAVVRQSGAICWLTIRGPSADTSGRAVVEAWEAVAAALRRERDKSDVAEVAPRPVDELRCELWVVPILRLSTHRPRQPWVRPRGIISSITIGGGDGPAGPATVGQRLPAGVKCITFVAVARCTRRRMVRVVWFVDDRPVRASRTMVSPGGRLIGSLTADHGLRAGRYRVEIQSASGLEASAEVIVLPRTPAIGCRDVAGTGEKRGDDGKH